MPTTVKSLEERVDEMADDAAALKADFIAFRLDFATVKGKAETMVKLLRWIGAFAAGVLVTVILSVVTIAFSAGRLESSVQEQSKQIQKLETHLEKLESRMQEQSKQINDISIQMTELRTLLKNPP